MSTRSVTKDFIFIDESGDPGLEPGGSRSIVVGCFHLTDIGLEHFYRHFAALTYFRTKLRELKSSRLSRLQKDQIVDIFKWLWDNRHASLSAVAVDKTRYTGPYLVPHGDQPARPAYFRNFLNRHLLERHFLNHPPVSNQVELIFDRLTSEEGEMSLKQYLKDNLRLPYLNTIIQCDSRTVPALQFVDTMVHVIKETLFGNAQSVDNRLLHCIELFDLTYPVKKAARPT